MVLKYRILAWVIQPEHWHAILQPRNTQPDVIIHRMKQNFSTLYRARHHVRQGRLWQHRYWDHVIRSPADLQRHVDYIHYNPVKHGLVGNPFDYRHSSLAWFAERGFYDEGWGNVKPDNLEGDFGE